MNLPAHRRGEGRWPEREFEQLREVFTRQLDRWPDFVDTLHDRMSDVAPLVDLEETDDSFVLEVELPGVKREDIDLQVDQNRVRLTGTRKERERVGLLRHRTRTTGRFSFGLTLPLPVDSDAVTASLDSGVLTVVVPKAEHSRRRRIPIASRR